ncbi:MAG: nucleotidyltransferase domain-containing protein [Candidatus Omnitrophica bacterium]|nr:nucleotidyltransferase domain-containing protein [Candidatus Omnitrophota bacterium]
MLKESELKILDYLTAASEGKGFISQIARDIGMSKGEVSKAVKVLKSCGLVDSEQNGRNMVCRVDRRLPVFARLRTAFNLMEIMSKTAVLQKCADKIVLFGSCSEGTDTTDSDIDLLVITRDKIKADKAARKIKFSRPVQWVIKTPQEYVVMNSKEKVFAGEISKGIVLWEGHETS